MTETLDIVMSLVLIALVVSMLIMQRKTARHAYYSGYWAGRNDEVVREIYEQNDEHIYADYEGYLSEMAQVVSQQLAERGVDYKEWPEWDGINRLVLGLPEESQAALLTGEIAARQPSFVRRFQWPWN